MRTHPVRRAGPWGLAARLERRCRARQGAQGSGCSALTPVGPGAPSWTRPGRARSRCLPDRSPRLAGTELSAARPGPGGRSGGARAACAADPHYLEDPQLPEVLGRSASRKPEHPGAVAALSSAGSEPGSTRAPWGRDTVRGQMPTGILALCLATTNPAAMPRPKVFADLLPSPPGLSPKTRFWRLDPRQDTYSR